MKLFLYIDYQDKLYDVTFSTGNTAILNIPLINDNILEENETFRLYVLQQALPDSVIQGDPSSPKVTIIDNDSKLGICAYICTYALSDPINLYTH